MKRAFFLMTALSLALMCACSSLTPESVKEILVDKTYYVVFEDDPGLTDKEGVYATKIGEGLRIGRIQSQTPGADEMVIVKISVKNEHKELMKDNTVFYVSDGKLEYETVGDGGSPLSEDAKLLGFDGKTGLYWFKTKSKVKSLSDAAAEKARELYDRAFE